MHKRVVLTVWKTTAEQDGALKKKAESSETQKGKSVQLLNKRKRVLPIKSRESEPEHVALCSGSCHINRASSQNNKESPGSRSCRCTGSCLLCFPSGKWESEASDGISVKSLSDGPDAGFGCILPVFVFYSVLRLFLDPKHCSKILENNQSNCFLLLLRCKAAMQWKKTQINNVFIANTYTTVHCTSVPLFSKKQMGFLWILPV